MNHTIFRYVSFTACYSIFPYGRVKCDRQFTDSRKTVQKNTSTVFPSIKLRPWTWWPGKDETSDVRQPGIGRNVLLNFCNAAGSVFRSLLFPIKFEAAPPSVLRFGKPAYNRTQPATIPPMSVAIRVLCVWFRIFSPRKKWAGWAHRIQPEVSRVL